MTGPCVVDKGPFNDGKQNNILNVPPLYRIFNFLAQIKLSESKENPDHHED
jgi:hypothetical protein